MKRSGFKPRGLLKPHPKAPKPLVPKATGRRLQPKDAHMHSEAHIKLVKAQRCLISGTLGSQYVAHHHPDELYPHLVSMGLKISDYLSVPLAHVLHQEQPGSLHVTGASPQWWIDHAFIPQRVYLWTTYFLRRHYPPGHPGSDYALEQIRIVLERQGSST